MDMNLTYVGIVLLIISAGEHYWVFWSAGPEQYGKFRATFSDRSKLDLIGVGLTAGAFLLPGLWTPLILFVSALAWVCWGTYQQHIQMVVEGFDPVFEARLLRSSFLAIAAVVCLFAGKLMGDLNAT